MLRATNEDADEFEFIKYAGERINGKAFVLIDGVLDLSYYGFLTYMTAVGFIQSDKTAKVRINIPKGSLNAFAFDHTICEAVESKQEDFNIHVVVGEQTDGKLIRKSDGVEFTQILVTRHYIDIDDVYNNIDIIVSNTGTSYYRIKRYKFTSVGLDTTGELYDNLIFKDNRKKILLNAKDSAFEFAYKFIMTKFNIKDNYLVVVLLDKVDEDLPEVVRDRPQCVPVAVSDFDSFEQLLNTCDIFVDTDPCGINDHIIQSMSYKGKYIITTNQCPKMSDDTLVIDIGTVSVPSIFLNMNHKGDVDEVYSLFMPGDLVDAINSCYLDCEPHIPQCPDGLVEMISLIDTILIDIQDV